MVDSGQGIFIGIFRVVEKLDLIFVDQVLELFL